MIVVHNPTDSPVKDYPIQDADSKEVKLWSIGAGETLEFPESVGKYLLEIYGFLQKVLTEDQFRAEKEEEKKAKEGKIFSQVKIVKAEGEIVPNVTPPAAGFTNENMQPANGKTEGPSAEEFPFLCPADKCGQRFRKDNLLRTHYALKHLELPTS